MEFRDRATHRREERAGGYLYGQPRIQLACAEWIRQRRALGGTFAGLPSAQPDPRFLSVTEISNQGISNYNGLTFQYRRAFSHGFQGQISYTWSHSLDDVSNGGSGLPYTFTAHTPTSLINPNITANYGNSDYDIRHNVMGDFVWDTPWKFSNRALNYLLGNWSLSSKFYVRTGVPESITIVRSLISVRAPSVGALS